VLQRESVYLKAQLALRETQGIVSSARNSPSFSSRSLMYVSISSEYTSLWMFSIAIWNP
jgi:hypothetical protein